MNKLKHNIRKLYVFRALKSCMLIMPIITIFFQDNGLTLSQIFLLQSIFSIVLFGFEVPTGYF